MENFKLVMPEHLNHYGYLFGGSLLKWVDEVAYITATLDYPGCNFVTIALDQVEFRQNARQGSILRFQTKMKHAGTTSVKYTVNVFRKNIDTGEESEIFFTNITFVRVDLEGRKVPLPR